MELPLSNRGEHSLTIPDPPIPSLSETHHNNGEYLLPRYNHTASPAAANRGQVYIFGGNGIGSASDDFFLFNCGIGLGTAN